MTKPADRFTLAALTTCAVLAACLAVVWIPVALAPGFLAWAAVYTGGTLGLARAVSLPPARTLWAATMLLVALLVVLLTTLKAVIDTVLPVLQRAIAAGTGALAPGEAV